MATPKNNMIIGEDGKLIISPYVVNGFLSIDDFDEESTVYVNMQLILTPAYNSIGEWYAISNGGDSTAKPNLIVKLLDENQSIRIAGADSDVQSVTVENGCTLFISKTRNNVDVANAFIVPISSGGGDITIPVATSTTLGGVKPSTGLTVAADGTLTSRVATAALTGIVKPSTGLTVAADGTLTSRVATAALTGIVKPSTGLTVIGDGTLTVNKATTTTIGAVSVGRGIDIDANGQISVQAHSIKINTSGSLTQGTHFYEDTGSVTGVTMPDATTLPDGAEIRIVSATPGQTLTVTLGTACNILYMDGTSASATATFTMPVGTMAEFVSAGNYWYQTDGVVTKP